MLKILISGFEPFGGSSVNPTERLVEEIRQEVFPGAEIRTLLLPVHYDECADILLQEMKACEPDAVIACGVAGAGPPLRRNGSRLTSRTYRRIRR